MGGTELAGRGGGSRAGSQGIGRARLILLLGGLIALGPLSIDLYLPALPAIARELRVADADVQFTLTGMLVGLAVGQVLVGPLSDAVGRRKPLIVGSAGLDSTAALEEQVASFVHRTRLTGPANEVGVHIEDEHSSA